MVQKPKLTAAVLFAGFNDRVIITLGLTQTIGYGTLYYSYGVLAPAISLEFGVGIDWFFGAFTIGILLGGFAAPLVGRSIDRMGARPVLAVGSLVAALALVACCLSPNVWLFSGAVILMEIAACLVLYEAAFAGLTQIYRTDARRAITLVTLIAGFASTVFWPLTQMMLEGFGWRATLAIFAVVHMLVCAPLHWFVLRRAVPVTQTNARQTDNSGTLVLEGASRQRALILYTAAIVISGLVYSAFPIHLLRIIENEGFTAQAAALIAMCMGPAQVLARLLEVLGGHRFDPLMTGKVALGALFMSIAILLATPGSTATAILFAVFYGAAQGLITIARGTVPLQLFGVQGYATLVGKITGIRFLVNAASPFLFALTITHFSTDVALLACGLAALISLATFMQLRKAS
jgi:MFS family permease